MSNPYANEDFLRQLLAKAVAAGASDVHLKVGQPPGVRVNGDMAYFRADKLVAAETEAVVRILLADEATPERMKALREHDRSYAVEGLGRFRVNIYRQRGTFAIVLRNIPMKVPSFEELGVPPPVRELALRERGLVLVVGAAGNGKSTTLAAMVNHINETQASHIVTIEDPVEFIHTDKRSSVSQREIGMDTESFASALRAALRQDPDVILVGEIRDGVTMEIAMQAAETGHLVLSTMHTPDVTRTVNRLLALSDSPAELRERLAQCLQGIVAQRLLPKPNGGLLLLLEILVATGTAREALKRPESSPPLKEVMEKGVTPYGMQTFEMAARAAVAEGKLSKQVAQQHMGF
ncbi:MAG: PilT/PilU family type 4a pilus ATPase [Myxococcales bacterium]|nr:PilT/PilU family type 4a pilus ATPase [Myxococcales bacterium]